MLKKNCIDTMYPSETLFPSGLTWRAWLRAGMALAHRQARQAWATVITWNNRHVQRRALGQLSEHMLKDIGISRMDALRESEKSFWRT